MSAARPPLPDQVLGTEEFFVKVEPTVTPDGESVAPLIDGVRIREARVQMEGHGTLCEIYSPAWGFTDDPLVYAYQFSIRPGEVRGWVVHREQDDRLFLAGGAVKAVLYDDRLDSPTYGMVNELFFGLERPGLLRIPAGVVHALANVGGVDAYAVNLPTAPYDHDDPDKYRLPLDSGLIPYRF